ncbi:uncharacterized protein LOC129572739 [Sitodiplosis mosellana]|uniref:uncharacterized protein LOC129572739 n=1 Tax=Sitodiplosis mosellana TaxID=263140 RepID=UPI0024440C1C|nr:uncharacterized protein LOC129572739 [Sitodiplosis mosellana]
MATAMDMDTQLPFRPFSLDTRKCMDSENRNRHMEFFTTFLGGLNMNKYGQWLRDVTYKELLNINDNFWTVVEENIIVDENGTISKPTEGGKMQFSRIIAHMKQRDEKLLEYNKEVVDSVNSINIIKVEKLDEILKYLLRISNYPMEPATNGNVAGYICKILDNVLHILQNSPHTRVNYFFTICAIILDLICGLNYVPFKDEYRTLNRMARKLDLIAKQTDNLEYIHGQGENEEEIKKNKMDKFHLVKYFYLTPKGVWQAKQAKNLRAKAHQTLTEFMSPNDAAVAIVADPFDVPYAEPRGHQSDAGSSVSVAPGHPSDASSSVDAAVAIVADPFDSTDCVTLE